MHVFTLLVIWLAAGVLYGMLFEDWGLVTSIYFSVAALSTGGEVTPSYIRCCCVVMRVIIKFATEVTLSSL